MHVLISHLKCYSKSLLLCTNLITHTDEETIFTSLVLKLIVKFVQWKRNYYARQEHPDGTTIPVNNQQLYNDK